MSAHARNVLELAPDEADTEIRRRVVLRQLGKVERYLRKMARASRLSDTEEVVRLLNFAEPTHELMQECLEAMEVGDA